ncbi:hypothetical protein SCB71_08625 [Herbiconiux sp. KACC 21604]|uniref:hypothetical protein n=1 Tax=unclassified Herbiconiux TaxID=2618217 RepID=UPI001490CA43|nr:hypothetical protein [Herbiconiux sp. SALV-R1]QJU53325.1 hypothetical protein HL652_06585 [Herbiconiux sp. SALV-R1]WPO88284.1 hypothetical protein SCB71_08625 [Herbiconiux sp. KACC 21604]
MTNQATSHMARPYAAFGATAVAVPLADPEIAGEGLPGSGRSKGPRRIEIVPSRVQRKARPKIAYAAVVVTGVLAIVVTQLLLSIGLSDGAYEIASLQQEQKELDRTNQVLTEQYDKLSSPQNLAAGAEALGMVANSTPVYLRLSDGAVLGVPTAAAGGSVTNGQNLIANSLLTPTDVTTGAAATADAGAGAATTADATADPATPSAPPVPEQQPGVAWQGALPAPTTH